MKRINIYIRPSIKIIEMETLTTFAASPGWDDTPNSEYSPGTPLSKHYNTSFGLWDWDNSELFQGEQFDEYADVEY
ncbi:MAG: hypothetical protein MRZ50_08255 [Prevotella sp.]|nr:hypothetical protein [Prevotella sp.]